nr:hypothetical protein [candidate division Zixibacteria bacterium]
MVGLSDNRLRNITWIIIGIIIIVGLYTRFSALDADPPLYFGGQGQSLMTDAHHYSYFPRNKVLFDQWEMFDTSRWRVFEVTLVSGLSYIVFSLFGISRFTANLPGLLLSLLSILFFVLALRRMVDFRGIFLALFLLVFNQVLYVYGRLPYTENGLIFLASLIFFVFVYYRDKLFGQIILGILVALAALTGKIFGYLLIIPVIAGFLVESRGNKTTAILTAVASCLALSAVWAIIVYGGSLNLLLGFYKSHTVGLHGFPAAFKSPLTFFEKLISFGNDSRFYYRAPALGIAGFIAFLLILCAISRDILKNNIPLVFLIVWFVVGQLFFMPQNYRPVRYIYMLYFPLTGLVAYVFTSSAILAGRRNGDRSYRYYILIFFLFWIFLEQLAFNILIERVYTSVYQDLVCLSAALAAILTYVEYRTGFIGFITSRYFKTAAVVFIIIFTLWNFGSNYYQRQHQMSLNIKEASRDLGQILDENAVVSGPMAPTLLLENNLKGFIYAVGISDYDPDLFRKNPVTHFAFDFKTSEMVMEKYPELKAAEPVTEYWINDMLIIVVRISDLTGNGISANYYPTEYERGREYIYNHHYDSALYYLEKFAVSHPENKSVLRTLGSLYPLLGQTDKGLEILKRAALLYPTDFSLEMDLGIYYQTLYVATGEAWMMTMARQHYKRVLEINPYHWDEIDAAARKITSRAGQNGN